MNILAIDSSNLVMGVAIATDQHVLGELVTNTNKNHSIRLMPAIEQLFKDVNLKPKDIDRIAVAEGPGSYTGVRIGVTIAKTMAWALKRDLVGVSSLEILAQNGLHFNGYVAPLFDARRGQVYTGLYQSKNDTVVPVKEDRLVMLEDWLIKIKELNQPILFLGNDVKIHWETISEYLGKWAIKPLLSENNPKPSSLAYLGMRREAIDVHSFTPRYLQLAEAEAKWLAKQEGK